MPSIASPAAADPAAPSTPSSAPSARWFCRTCHKQPAACAAIQLTACSRCRLVRYCSPVCRQRDAARHAALCQYIRSLRRELRQSTNAIKPLLRSRCGHFYDTTYTRAYLLAHSKLAHELEHLAKEYSIVPLLERVLSYRLEIVRLDARDRMRIRETVPFTLLRLRRDTHCVAFIGHWLLRERGVLDPLKRHERSQYGDWLYGEADRFGDVFASTGADIDSADMSFLLPLCIVKLRLLSRPTVAAECVAEQEALLDKYLDALQRKNPVLLQALANPEPLIRARVHDGSAPCHEAQAQAYLMLFFCGELFDGVPGAKERLERRLGASLQYHCERFSFL